MAGAGAHPMSLRLSDDRLQRALTYLAETDEPCAALKADAARTEWKAKAIRDAIYLRSDGAAATRQATAGASDAYATAMQAHFEALAKFEAMKNKRATETLVVEVWRSLNANRRTGNVV